jgi:carbon monoxide dehydrogenase subunit G
MDMTGEYRIPAPRQSVWEALNDPDVLRQCIPGCQEIVKETPTDWRGKVVAKVGPVKASFSGKITLSDLDPPNGYTIAGEGTGGAAGFAKGSAAVRLTGDGEATVLAYTVKANVGGKLAQIGSRLIDGTARKMADDFFGRFAALVGAAEVSAAPAEIVETAVPTGAVEAPGAMPGLDSRATAVLASEGAGPPPVSAEPRPTAGGTAERRSLSPIVWVAGLAVVVAALVAVFARR